jgi:hypothetical protein
MTHRLALANTTVPAGNVVANTTTLTTFADVGIVINPNADTASGNGKVFKMAGRGYLSSKASGAGTLTISPIYNNTSQPQSLGAATLTLPDAATNIGWQFLGEAVVCATGSAQGRISCQGMLLVDNAGTPISAALVNVGTGTAGHIAPPSGTLGNQQILLGLAAQFSVADAGNTITMAHLIIEVCS